jgi:hypothetical protein
MPHDHAIVFGASRSGTTFLMSVLDGLPEAECVTGNLFPTPLIHLAAQQPPPETEELLARSFRGALRDFLGSASYRSRSAALRKWWIADRGPAGLRAAARGERRERVVVYKEPFLSFAPAFAYETFPGSRLIYLLRDGRDVADSMVRKYDILSDARLANLENNEGPLGRSHGNLMIPWWVDVGEEERFIASDQFGRAIWMWAAMARRSQAFIESPEVVAAGRILTVRYEELMADPAGQGEALIHHLGMTVGRQARRRLAAAHDRSVGIHTRRDPESVSRAEAIAGDELRRCGYPLAGDHAAAPTGELPSATSRAS